MAAKLKIKAGISLIRQDDKKVASINMVAFAWDGIGDVEVALFFGENADNIEKFIYYTFKYGRRDEVSKRVTNLVKRKISLNSFLI